MCIGPTPLAAAAHPRRGADRRATAADGGRLAPAEAAADQAALDRLLAAERAERLAPRPLSRNGVGRLIADGPLGAGANPGRAFIDACHEVTAGNPLLVRELTLALAAEGVATDEEGVRRAREIGPQPVAIAVELTLGRLRPEAVAVAEAVAVLEDGADLDDVAAVAGLPAEVVAASVAELRRSEILGHQGLRLGFVHPIVGASVRERMGSHRRGDLRRRAAQALAARSDAADRIAAHLLEAPPAGDELGRRCPGGGRTRRHRPGRPGRRGPLSGARVDRAARRPPAGPARSARPRPVRLRGRSRGRHLREGAALEPDGTARARLAVDHGRALLALGHFTEAVAVLETGIADVGDEVTLRRELEAVWAAAAIFDPAPGRSRRRSAWLPCSAPTSSRRRGANANCWRSWPGPRPCATGTASRRWPGPGGRGARARCWPRRPPMTPRWARSPWRSRRATSTPCAWRSPTPCSPTRGAAAPHRRSLPPATSAAPSSCSPARCRMPSPTWRPRYERYGWQAFLPSAAAHLALALLAAGEAERARALVALDPRREDRWSQSPVWPRLLDARGQVALADGDLAAALAAFEEAGALATAMGFANPRVLRWRAGRAGALLALGRREAALSELETELVDLRAWGAPSGVGSGLRALGAARGDLVLLEEAVAVLEPSVARLERARALADLGRARLAAADRAAGQDALRRALDGAEACGARALAEHARAALVSSGARPRRRRITGPESLTPAERRVADRAAAGLTNREIAEALFVTRKAVEWHLANIFRKLDIGSRAELADALRGDD